MSELEDPRKEGERPPYDEEEQDLPGLQSEMEVQPDYGKESYVGSGRLKGRAALITGGDSGIGRAAALAFAREGADVVISYLEGEQEDAEQIAADIRAEGRTVVLAPGDISDPEHCKALVERTVEELGKIDILVNNAAYQKTFDSIAEVTQEEIEHTFKTNIFAMFYLCQAAMEEMEPGSTIINVTSIQAYQPSPTLLPYASTKGAILTFTKGLAQEAIDSGIRVNAVAPGPIWTPLIPATIPMEDVKQFGKDTPTGRAGQPAELAPLFVFLASDESSYITGEVVGVTGGKPLA